MNLYWMIEAAGVPPNITALMQLAADCCAIAEGVALPCGIGVTVTDDAQIRKLNRETRKIDAATDVLSFPTVNYAAGETAGRALKRLRKEYDASLGVCYLGDIVLSMDHVRAQAEEYGHSLAREASYLLAHGVCHLLGYDHMTDIDKAAMRALEEKALGMMRIDGEEQRAEITDGALLALARQAMERSYAPYSKYRVGACLLCADGRVFQGCNVENASFGLTNCAERTAVFAAVSEGATEFEAIAIAARDSAPWPCGACRQVLNEFAPTIRVLVTWGDGQTASARLDELLPHGFGPRDLPEKK